MCEKEEVNEEYKEKDIYVDTKRIWDERGAAKGEDC